MQIIETENLTKYYGKTPVVDSLSLSVPEGSVYGFIGPNGAGKSTTMKMLLGLVKPNSGSIRLLGKSMTQQNRLSLLRQTGSLIESPACYGHLTGEENLQILAELKNVPERNIDRVLEIVELTDSRRRKVQQYSLGMRQRLGIAQALLGNPKLLILDEPTNGLDPSGIQQMRSLIKDMPNRCGATVLISSHLLGEMEQMVRWASSTTAGFCFRGSWTICGSTVRATSLCGCSTRKRPRQFWEIRHGWNGASSTSPPWTKRGLRS